MYEDEREFATKIAIEVSDLTRLVQDSIVTSGESLTKGDRSPVTLADLAVQVVVSCRLADRFPTDPLLAEEDSAPLTNDREMAQRVLGLAQDFLPRLTESEMVAALDRGGYEGDPSGRYWVLDPIDGTKGFLRGEQYAIALALVDRGEVVVGVLGCPNLPAGDKKQGCVFSAGKDRGTFAHILGGDDDFPIFADTVTDPAKAVVCESVEAAHAAHSVQGRIAARLGITAPSYRVDSQCKYAVVARGEASIYLRLPRDASYREKVWDHAAGALVTTEAGGRVTDLDGNPLDFSQGRLLGRHRGIVATSGAIHDQVLEACRTVLAEE